MIDLENTVLGIELGSTRIKAVLIDGDHIPIELRDPEEIRSKFYAEPMAPAGVKCYNPAFDVTDHTLLAGIVTEKGICRPPFAESLAALFRDKP